MAPGDAIGVVDTAILTRLRADTGGDAGFSHGRNLGKASTRTTVRRGEAVVEADGSRQVWAILQGGTTAHVVKASQGRFLRTPHGPRREVRVRGVRARETFSEGADRGLEMAARELDRAWSRVGS